MDEPASGLDPRARIEVRELLKELKNMGKTILISSHILHELAQLCTRIGIIEAGQMVAQGPLDEIYRRLQLMRMVHVQLADARAKMCSTGCGEFPASNRSIGRSTASPFACTKTACRSRICTTPSTDAGGRIRMYQPEAMDMETAFMKLTQGTTA